ncbi:MAG: AAA family ATPase [Xanthomonadales bacterium]|nr:AAA family ATPase [Xanthomonadales bacterium]
MKTIVIKEKENTRVPFLRGILTRSLLDAGLVFEDSFKLATQVRDDLVDSAEISSGAIRSKICDLLKKHGHLEALELYRLPHAGLARIQVIGQSGEVSSFSRSRHERYLQASGIKADKSEQITARIYNQFLAAGVSTISNSQLAYLTYLCLRQEVSKKAAKRYLVWSEFQRSARPLLLLICGTVGTGKSTVATEIAHVLDIVRIQSTDMLREVMRMMLPNRLLPILHTSSFNAWQALPIHGIEDRDKDQLVADGYRSQADLLAVPCDAVLHRAIEESVPMILEGVHAHPEIVSRLPSDSGAIVVHVTLAVLKPKELKSRLRGRGVAVPQRRAKRYLSNFDAVWSLQSFLLSEADRCNVPIITNDDKEKAVLQIILQVVEELSRHFDGSPGMIFGPIAESEGEAVDRVPWKRLVSRLNG